MTRLHSTLRGTLLASTLLSQGGEGFTSAPSCLMNGISSNTCETLHGLFATIPDTESEKGFDDQANKPWGTVPVSTSSSQKKHLTAEQRRSLELKVERAVEGMVEANAEGQVQGMVERKVEKAAEYRTKTVTISRYNVKPPTVTTAPSSSMSAPVKSRTVSSTLNPQPSSKLSTQDLRKLELDVEASVQSLVEGNAETSVEGLVESRMERTVENAVEVEVEKIFGASAPDPGALPTVHISTNQLSSADPIPFQSQQSQAAVPGTGSYLDSLSHANVDPPPSSGSYLDSLSRPTADTADQTKQDSSFTYGPQAHELEAMEATAENLVESKVEVIAEAKKEKATERAAEVIITLEANTEDKVEKSVELNTESASETQVEKSMNLSKVQGVAEADTTVFPDQPVQTSAKAISDVEQEKVTEQVAKGPVTTFESASEIQLEKSVEFHIEKTSEAQVEKATDLSRVEVLAEADIAVLPDEPLKTSVETVPLGEKDVESKSSTKGFAEKLADEAKSFAQKLSFGIGYASTNRKDNIEVSPKEAVSSQANVKQEEKERAVPKDTLESLSGNEVDIGAIEGETESAATDKIKNDMNLLSTLESNAEAKVEVNGQIDVVELKDNVDIKGENISPESSPLEESSVEKDLEVTLSDQSSDHSIEDAASEALYSSTDDMVIARSDDIVGRSKDLPKRLSYLQEKTDLYIGQKINDQKSLISNIETSAEVVVEKEIAKREAGSTLEFPKDNLISSLESVAETIMEKDMEVKAEKKTSSGVEDIVEHKAEEGITQKFASWANNMLHLSSKKGSNNKATTRKAINPSSSSKRMSSFESETVKIDNNYISNIQAVAETVVNKEINMKEAEEALQLAEQLAQEVKDFHVIDKEESMIQDADRILAQHLDSMGMGEMAPLIDNASNDGIEGMSLDDTKEVESVENTSSLLPEKTLEHETITKGSLEAGAFFQDEEHNEALVKKDNFNDDSERDLADQGVAPTLVVEADIRSEDITLTDPSAPDKHTEESSISELNQRSLLQARLNFDSAAKNKRRRLAEEMVHRSLLQSRLYIHDKMKISTFSASKNPKVVDEDVDMRGNKSVILDDVSITKNKHEPVNDTPVKLKLETDVTRPTEYLDVGEERVMDEIRFHIEEESAGIFGASELKSSPSVGLEAFESIVSEHENSNKKSSVVEEKTSDEQHMFQVTSKSSDKVPPKMKDIDDSIKKSTTQTISSTSASKTESRSPISKTFTTVNQNSVEDKPSHVNKGKVDLQLPKPNTLSTTDLEFRNQRKADGLKPPVSETSSKETIGPTMHLGQRGQPKVNKKKSTPTPGVFLDPFSFGSSREKASKPKHQASTKWNKFAAPKKSNDKRTHKPKNNVFLDADVLRPDQLKSVPISKRGTRNTSPGVRKSYAKPGTAKEGKRAIFLDPDHFGSNKEKKSEPRVNGISEHIKRENNFVREHRRRMTENAAAEERMRLAAEEKMKSFDFAAREMRGRHTSQEPKKTEELLSERRRNAAENSKRATEAASERRRESIKEAQMAFERAVTGSKGSAEKSKKRGDIFVNIEAKVEKIAEKVAEEMVTISDLETAAEALVEHEVNLTESLNHALFEKAKLLAMRRTSTDKKALALNNAEEAGSKRKAEEQAKAFEKKQKTKRGDKIKMSEGNLRISEKDRMMQTTKFSEPMNPFGSSHAISNNSQQEEEKRVPNEVQVSKGLEARIGNAMKVPAEQHFGSSHPIFSTPLNEIEANLGKRRGNSGDMKSSAKEKMTQSMNLSDQMNPFGSLPQSGAKTRIPKGNQEPKGLQGRTSMKVPASEQQSFGSPQPIFSTPLQEVQKDSLRGDKDSMALHERIVKQTQLSEEGLTGQAQLPKQSNDSSHPIFSIALEDIERQRAKKVKEGKGLQDRIARALEEAEEAKARKAQVPEQPLNIHQSVPANPIKELESKTARAVEEGKKIQNIIARAESNAEKEAERKINEMQSRKVELSGTKQVNSPKSMKSSGVETMTTNIFNHGQTFTKEVAKKTPFPTKEKIKFESKSVAGTPKSGSSERVQRSSRISYSMKQKEQSRNFELKQRSLLEARLSLEKNKKSLASEKSRSELKQRSLLEARISNDNKMKQHISQQHFVTQSLKQKNGSNTNGQDIKHHHTDTSSTEGTDLTAFEEARKHAISRAQALSPLTSNKGQGPPSKKMSRKQRREERKRKAKANALSNKLEKAFSVDPDQQDLIETMKDSIKKFFDTKNKMSKESKDQAPKAQLGLKKGKKVEPISLQNVDGKSKKILSGKEAKVAAEGKKRRK